MLVQKRKGSSFSIEERHQVIQDYLSSGKKKVEIWYKHTGQIEEHGEILRWMRQLGYIEESKKVTFASSMKKEKQDNQDSPIENSQLKKRIRELEKALEHSKLKAFAYSTMIDVAEEELKISIRKK